METMRDDVVGWIFRNTQTKRSWAVQEPDYDTALAKWRDFVDEETDSLINDHFEVTTENVSQFHMAPGIVVEQPRGV